MINQYTPTISVKEARKLLGKDSKQIDDAQVEELLSFLSLLSRHYLSTVGSKKLQGVITLKKGINNARHNT